MELNSAVGRADGVTDAELDSLATYAASPLFSEREKTALRYAEAVTTGNTVPDELFALVRQRFSEDEVVELTATITWEICAAKFNRALEIEAQGVCRVAIPIAP
jgi:alkylhydroperoxidase family enzyme